MEFWELVAFTLRIAAPILAFIILSVCFWSLNDGRRTDHALVVLQDDNTGKIYPVTFWENLIGRSDKTFVFQPFHSVPDGFRKRPAAEPELSFCFGTIKIIVAVQHVDVEIRQQRVFPGELAPKCQQPDHDTGEFF